LVSETVPYRFVVPLLLPPPPPLSLRAETEEEVGGKAAEEGEVGRVTGEERMDEEEE